MTDTTTFEPIRGALSATDPNLYEFRRMGDEKLLAVFFVEEDHAIGLVHILLTAIKALASETVDTTGATIQ